MTTPITTENLERWAMHGDAHGGLAVKLAREALRERKRAEEAEVQLAQVAEVSGAEVLRLRNVIKTGGAMYRAERATMGIPGGIDPHQRAEDELFALRKAAARLCWELKLDHTAMMNAEACEAFDALSALVADEPAPAAPLHCDACGRVAEAHSNKRMCGVPVPFAPAPAAPSPPAAWREVPTEMGKRAFVAAPSPPAAATCQACEFDAKYESPFPVNTSLHTCRRKPTPEPSAPSVEASCDACGPVLAAQDAKACPKCGDRYKFNPPSVEAPRELRYGMDFLAIAQHVLDDAPGMFPDRAARWAAKLAGVAEATDRYLRRSAPQPTQSDEERARAFLFDDGGSIEEHDDEGNQRRLAAAFAAVRAESAPKGGGDAEAHTCPWGSSGVFPDCSGCVAGSAYDAARKFITSERTNLADLAALITAREQAAEARGRDKGLEEAATIAVEQWPNGSQTTAAAIRALRSKDVDPDPNDGREKGERP